MIIITLLKLNQKNKHTKNYNNSILKIQKIMNCKIFKNFPLIRNSGRYYRR